MQALVPGRMAHMVVWSDHSSLLGASTAKAFEDVDSRPAKKARKFIKKTK
jgi:hypothetical protein